MDVEMALFGSRRRTEVLLALALLEESHASELAKVLQTQVRTIQRILAGLEAERVIEGRIVGRERRVALSRRFAAAAELRALLIALAMREPELDGRVAALRRRPRQAGKQI